MLRLGPPPGLGVFTLLNQCVLDAANPLLREWGLLGVRNADSHAAAAFAASSVRPTPANSGVV